ncbi:helix-turn-helix domain-containing protein [Alteromonas antoniana]|uniref:helix-turn-helix domain-containing protein n=1 Tax=Alteromonas antoniana TaxID=2803813 RepID=UPI001C479592|nr:helix-turn-helix transcriptional regulator [Alteromonas antoniana]
MQKVQVFIKSIGRLVSAVRSDTMDQTELAERTGLSRSTISAMENGRPVNVKAVVSVLEHLDLLDDFQALVDDKLAEKSRLLLRKSRQGNVELDNDF